jgi:Glucodextranase, domain B
MRVSDEYSSPSTQGRRVGNSSQPRCSFPSQRPPAAVLHVEYTQPAERHIGAHFGSSVPIAGLLLVVAVGLSVSTRARAATAIPGPLDFGAYATGGACGAMNISGGAYTDSFDSSQGTYTQTRKLAGGDIGVTANATLSGGAVINGSIAALNTTVGTCTNGAPGISLSGGAIATAGYIKLTATPSTPNPPPVTPGTQDLNFTNSATLSPGRYRNITVNGGATLTLSPGVYNINSINLSGNSILTFSPASQVVINVAGNQVTSAINFSGGTIVNPSGIPLNLQLLYGGGLPVMLSGGSASYGVVYAPNSPASLSGNSGWYGAIVVRTLNDSGGTPIHYDRSLATLPIIQGAITPIPNGAGWNNTNATVSFACSDPVFAITSCTSPVQVNTEGANQIVPGKVVDAAGLTASASVAVNLDKTPPAIGVSSRPPPNIAGWNNSSVAVTFACSDALSGIASCTPGVIVSADGAAQVVAGTAVDKAGNTASAAARINLDKTPPAITAVVTPAPNAAGWNNSNATVSFICSDSLSGIAVCPVPVQFTTDRANQTASGTAFDKAGNSASASAVVSLDETPPTLTITSPANGTTVNPGSLTVTGSVTDALSGVASVTCQGTAATISGSNFSCTVTIAAGPNTVTVQGVDNAGNTVQASVSIQGGIPTLLSVNPNTGPQGQQNLSVALTGQYTHFAQGTTTASFGAGTTVVSMTVASPTTATAVLNIDPAAALGARDVTVSTGGEIVTLISGFTVTGVPTLISISPNSSVQGQANLPVTITGQNTHFTNASAIDLGAGILVGGISAVDVTHLNALLTIDGPANIVQNGSLEDLNNAFVNTADNYMNLSAGATTIPGWTVTPGTIGAIVWGKSPTTDNHTAPNGTFFVDLSGLGSNSPNGALQQQLQGLIVGQQYTFWMDTDVVGQLPLVTVGSATVALSPGAPFTAGYDIWTPQTGTFIADSPNPMLTIMNQKPGQQIVFIDNIVITGPTGASLGLHNLTVSSGSEVVTLSNAFTVNPVPFTPPAVTQVSPNTGLQGQQDLPVTISSQFTHWAQGTTTVAFGPGITVQSLNVKSPTTAVAALSIDPAAAIGARTVTLTTVNEMVALNNGFIVNPGTPSLTLANPSSGQQGQQSLSVALTGQYTHFAQGTTTASFGAGITVASLTISSPTTATAVLNIDPATATGPRELTLSTGGEIVTLSSGFTVIGSPTLLSISPNSGTEGQVNVPVTITGQNTRFTNASLIDLGAAITANGISAEDATHLNALLTITGSGNLVQNGSLEDLNNAFVNTTANYMSLSAGATTIANWTVAPGTIGTIVWGKSPTADNHTASNGSFFVDLTGFGSNSPNGALQQQLQNLIVGQQYAFSMDTEVVGQLPVVTVGGIAVALSPGAAFTAGSDIWTPQTGSFIANATNPVLTIANQSPGQQITFIDNIAITGPSSLGLGLHNLTVTSGSEVVTLNNAFTVNPLLSPAVTQVSPNTGLQGQQGLSVAITGQSTHWVQGTTTATFGPGITVSSLTINSPTTASASLNFDLAAATGVRNVTLTTGAEVAMLTNNFTVSPGVPVLITVSPNTGLQGQQGLAITSITGQFTHWVQGTTIANFGPGITVATLTINSSTSASAVLNIDPAATGTRNVTLTCGVEVATLINGFTVASSTPAITLANPSSGQQGQGLAVAVTGQATHFAQGTTTASFGAGITVANLIITSATSATVVLNIDPATATGPRDVTLTTGMEVVTLTNGFTVTAGSPALISLSPNTGQQGQQGLAITSITGQFTHWVQGTTTANFGPGITVAALTINSPTSASAVLNIDPAAATGAHNVTLTTNTETVTLTSGLTVLPTSGPSTISVLLSAQVVAPGDSTTFTPVVLDGNGNPITNPNLPVTVTIAAVGNTAGNSPIVTGSTITFPKLAKQLLNWDQTADPDGIYTDTDPSDPNYGQETGGVYQVTASLSSPAITGSSLVVVLPTGTANVTTQVYNYGAQLDAALTQLATSLNNQDNTGFTAGKAALQAVLDNTNFTTEYLSINEVFAPPDGALLTAAQMLGAGLAPNLTDDGWLAALQQVHNDILTAIAAVNAVSPTSPTATQLASVESATTTYLTDLATLNSLQPSPYALAVNNDLLNQVMNLDIPALFDSIRSIATSAASPLTAKLMKTPASPIFMARMLPRLGLALAPAPGNTSFFQLISEFTRMSKIGLRNIVQLSISLANDMILVKIAKVINAGAPPGLSIDYIQAAAAAGFVSPNYPNTFVDAYGLDPTPKNDKVVLLGAVNSGVLAKILLLKPPKSIGKGIKLLFDVYTSARKLANTIGIAAVVIPDVAIPGGGIFLDGADEIVFYKGWPEVNQSSILSVGVVIVTNANAKTFAAQTMLFP